MRTFDSNKGERITEEIYKKEPVGIGFRELKRNTGFSNDAIASWCKRFLLWKKIGLDAKGKIRLTEQYKAEFEQKIPLPIDSRKREIKLAKEKEQRQKRLLLTAAIAASNSRYFRRVGNIQAGDVGINDTISRLKGEQKIFDYRSYELPGVGVADIVNKPPHSSSRIEYRPNKIRPLSNLFAYIMTNPDEAEQCINKLMLHDPPVLKRIEFRGRARYVNADPLLKDFIEECLVMLSYTRERMNLAWVYGKQIDGKALEKVFQEEYLKWFTKLYGSTRIKSTHFTYLNAERKRFHKSDKPTQSTTIHTVKLSIGHYDRSIRSHSIELSSEKFIHIRRKYGFILEPLVEFAYPKFLKQIHRKSLNLR